MKEIPMIQSKWKDVLLFLLFCVLIYFPVFLHLDSLPLRLWDEALFAMRALYMHQEGGFMYNFNYFPGLPDHPNVKLPFTTFFQVLGLKFFGINELALRLPVSFIFLATLFYVIFFMKRLIGNYYVGFLFGLILLTSTRFLDSHMLRTGDQDVPFACYLLLAVLFFYRFIQYSKATDLAFFSFFILAALLTKSLLAGIILPGLIAYVLIKGKFKDVLKDNRIYIALGMIIAIFAGVLFYFEMQQHGFIIRMWNYELGGRYAETIEGHQGGPFFYLQELISGFSPFIYLFPVAILFFFDKKLDPDLKNLLILLLCTAVSYLLIISFSGTKTYWYNAPTFLFVALMIAIAVYHLFKNYILKMSAVPKWGIIIVFILIYIYAYSKAIDKVYFHKAELHQDEEYGNYIEHLKHTHPDIKEFTIVDDNFSSAALFYKEKYNAINNSYYLKHQRTLDIDSGTVVMACLYYVWDPLQKMYETEIISEYKSCKLIRVYGKKH